MGDMVFHPSHNHFHFQNFARYELWTRADYDNWVASNRAQGQAIKPGAKTTFCIMNTDLAQPSPSSPSNPVYGSCSPSVQGLSVGWGDTYGYYLVDQWIDLGTSSLPDGQYILRSMADPSNLEDHRQYDLVINTPFGRGTLVCLITKIARMFRYYNWTQHWTQQLIAGRHPPPSPGGASRSSDPSVRRNAMSSRKKNRRWGNTNAPTPSRWCLQRMLRRSS